MLQAVIDLKAKAWSPSVPIKAPDNIISSKFASQKVFVPSYEKEKRPCIEQLLTNEYQRIWWEEKEVWDKRFQRKMTTKQLLLRGSVKRQPRAALAYTAPKAEKKQKPKKKAEKGTEARRVTEQMHLPKTAECDNKKAEADTQTDCPQPDKEA